MILRGHRNSVASTTWSPDGQRIVSSSWDKTVRIWDAKSGQSLMELKGHTDPIRSAAWSPDGQKIVSASEDKTLRIWDATSGQSLHELKGHTGGVLSASWSPDGQRIISANWDNTLRIWNILKNENAVVQLTEREGVFGVNDVPVRDYDFQALARHAVETGEFYALNDRAIELGLI
jgi:WD40 repeat protein